MTAAPHILVIEARYYEAISEALWQGAQTALDEAGATYDRIDVPGVLEIPATVSMALTAMDNGKRNYDGFVALGCVIRGETSHYDIVAIQSARALMDLSIDADLAFGNGILTVENEAQAWARAKMDEKDKGGFAARAALHMVKVRESLGV